MDNSNRTAGSGSSKGSNVLLGTSSNNNISSRQNQSQPQRYQAGSPSFPQIFQASPNSDQRMFQMKMQEMQLRQLRQNHLQQRLQQQQQMSPSSTQMQQQQPNQEQQRRLSQQLSPNTLLLTSSPLVSPGFAGQMMGSPTSASVNGQGSLNSLKSVFSQFQQQSRQSLGAQLPPAPPLISGPATTSSTKSSTMEALHSSSVANTTIEMESHSKAQSVSNKKTTVTVPPPLGPEETADLVRRCDWVDKTIWVSRQLLGGQSVNGFLRATSTVQRIKKQRARQNQKGKSSTGIEASKKRGLETTEQDEEEILKSEVMNPRTAKKMKTELELGISFCRLLHATVRSILQEMDPTLPHVEMLGSDSPNAKSNIQKQSASTASANYLVDINKSSQRMHADTGNNNNSSNQLDGSGAVTYVHQQDTTGSLSPGNPNGSTLRKNRKNKLPPNTEPPINLPEFDNTGKRLCTKKEHLYRLSECIRYRALRKGDVVAARVSSRNLWIVATVTRDYPSADIPLLDFVRLTDVKREQLFKDKVHIRDVEDKHSNESDSNFKVARSLVLPLPRSFSEAAEWAQRFKKGSRVYALYPDTTALYTATVLDSTTYARDDDDIIVVRFDGDEPDSSGSIPSCHIPARFVTLIPRGLLAGATSSSSTSSSSSALIQQQDVWSGGNNSKKKNATTDVSAKGTTIPPPPSDHELNFASNLDEINLDDPLPGLDGFDDLDFDLLGT